MTQTSHVIVPVEPIVRDIASQLAASISELGFPVGMGIAPPEEMCLRAARGIVALYGRSLSAAPAPEGGAVDRWRPFDSVPMDGTVIDLWGHWPEHDRWVRTPDAVWDEERRDWKVNGFYAGAYAYPPRFTHWRPITGPDTTRSDDKTGGAVWRPVSEHDGSEESVLA
ncbi:hypothetical protein ACFPIF_10400, partial [Brevundimonas faecalis]|uniref:hypothetical protein n=1 Tax=Brevundimonas faecalis TaxID=947378 RepID=UPI00361DAC92